MSFGVAKLSPSEIFPGEITLTRSHPPPPLLRNVTRAEWHVAAGVWPPDEGMWRLMDGSWSQRTAVGGRRTEVGRWRVAVVW